MIAQPKLLVKVLIALRQQKSAGKQSVPFFGEAVYCIQHELHKRVARALCSFAVAACTRYVEAKKEKGYDSETDSRRNLYAVRGGKVRDASIVLYGASRNPYAVRRCSEHRAIHFKSLFSTQKVV